MSRVELQRAATISREVDAAASLFRHGLRVIEGYRFALTDAESVFVLLAGGMEKLLKLSIGFDGLAATGTWRETKERRHFIVTLDRDVRSIVRNRAAEGVVTPYVGTLLAAVDEDPDIDFIMQTLERYADRGRYYNLDFLAGDMHTEPSPSEMWEELQQALLARRPDLLEALGTGDWDAGRSGLNAAIAGSIRAWYELIQRSWLCGVFGPKASGWAPQLGLDL